MRRAQWNPSQALPASGCSHLPVPESRSSGAIRSERAAADVGKSGSAAGGGCGVTLTYTCQDVRTVRLIWGCDSGGEAGAHALLTVFYAIALEKYGPGPLLTPHCASCRPNSR